MLGSTRSAGKIQMQFLGKVPMGHPSYLCFVRLPMAYKNYVLTQYPEAMIINSRKLTQAHSYRCYWALKKVKILDTYGSYRLN